MIRDSRVVDNRHRPLSSPSESELGGGRRLRMVQKNGIGLVLFRRINEAASKGIHSPLTEYVLTEKKTTPYVLGLISYYPSR